MKTNAHGVGKDRTRRRLMVCLPGWVLTITISGERVFSPAPFQPAGDGRPGRRRGPRPGMQPLRAIWRRRYRLVGWQQWDK